MTNADPYEDGAHETREDFTTNDFRIKRVLDPPAGHGCFSLGRSSPWALPCFSDAYQAHAGDIRCDDENLIAGHLLGGAVLIDRL